MFVVYLILAALALAGSLYCSVIILIDAFQYDTWAGVGCIVCGLYFLYYAFAEFDHAKKWQLVAGSVVGLWVAALFFELAFGVPIGGPARRWY